MGLSNANNTSGWTPNKIFLNFTSGVSGGAYPNAVASYINPRLFEYLHDGNRIYNRGYGIIPMDFPPQDLIDIIFDLSIKDKYVDRLVILQSEANYKYVCAEDGGNKPLIANRDTASTWETFRIFDRGNNNIALQAAANGKFVSAENGGKESLIANRDVVDTWETFKLINLENNYIFLQSAANSKYICAEDGGNKPLIANRDTASTWEKFKLIPI